MGEISSEQEFFKVDRRGHVRVPKERREALLDEFERSGVSAAEFAAHFGVRYSTFAHWRQVRERQRQRGDGMAVALPSAAPETAVKWVEAIVDKGNRNNGEGRPENNTALWIALPGGARLEIATSTQVSLAVELLRALETNGGTGC